MTVGPRELLVAAALSAAAFFGVYAIAYEWHTGGQLDGRALLGFSVIRVSLATHAAHFFQSLCNPAPYLVICLVVLAIVLATRGVLRAAAFVVVIAGANASTKALKPLIASAAGVHTGPLATVGVAIVSERPRDRGDGARMRRRDRGVSCTAVARSDRRRPVRPCRVVV